MDINDEELPVVSVARLFDGKLSVRVNEFEVCLLPVQQECSMDDIQRCLNLVVKRVADELPDTLEPVKPYYPGW